MHTKYSAKNSGNVNYGSKVVESIISLATLEVSGVESLQGKKILIDKNGDIYNIDVFINVMSDVTCSDVAFRVQENVKRALESMTAYRANHINVNILGVCFEEKN
jgi:uncharacterized alkaline shock family protein YloU